MRSLRITAVAVLTAMLGVACGSAGGGGGDPEAIQLISAAAVANNEAGTSKITMDMSMGSGAQGLNMTGEGEVDIDAQRAQMSMTMSADDPAMGIPGDGKIEMVIAGLKVYTRYPPEIAAQIPGNKPWSMIDMEEVGKAQGMDLGAMSQLTGSDPSQVLQYLQGVSGDVETVGEEEIHGVNTTHYRATIDLDKIADHVSEDLRDNVRMSIDALKKQLGKTTLPVEAWIGDDGYVHRMAMSMETGADAPQPFQMEMTMEMYDFGAPVSIEVPDASQVFDMTEMMTSGVQGEMKTGTVTAP